MHQHAERYVDGLPNFVCTQVTEQFEAGKRSDKWHKNDVLEQRLVFVDGHERRSMVRVNGKPVEKMRRKARTPLVSEGEFGTLLGRVLGEDLAALLTQPPFDASAMDGYAVRAADVADVPVTLKLAGQSLAGAGFGAKGRADGVA